MTLLRCVFFCNPGGCFTNISWALQNNLAKVYNARNHIYGANFKLKLCTCTQSMALSMHTKFWLEIHIRITISIIHKFRENILESSWNCNKIPPWHQLWQQIAWDPANHSQGISCHPASQTCDTSSTQPVWIVSPNWTPQTLLSVSSMKKAQIWLNVWSQYWIIINFCAL